MVGGDLDARDGLFCGEERGDTDSVKFDTRFFRILQRFCQHGKNTNELRVEHRRGHYFFGSVTLAQRVDCLSHWELGF